MISKRSKSSLCEYLTLYNPARVRLLFDRHGIPFEGLMAQGMEYTPYIIDALKQTIFSATLEQLLSLLEGIVRTSSNLSHLVTQPYIHNERWDDLFQCLQLDGYIINGQNLIPIEPIIEGTEPLEDDLSKELKCSGLAVSEEILRLLDESAKDFRKVTPDYNGCLNNARVALQTLAKSIAKARKITHSGSFEETKWGQVLAFLRTSSLISQQEEDGITGVYSFVSPGAHIPIGLSEQETARLGRNLVSSMCYYLVKLYNKSKKH
jgi:hypothetical protein